MIYTLIGRSQQFTKDIEWAIMACDGFEKHLTITKKALSQATNVRETTKATCQELETQLKEFMVELIACKKIQDKVDEALVVENEEVIHLDALLMEDQASWA